MESSVKWIVLGILFVKVSIVMCFYPEYIIEDFCKAGNETIFYETSALSSFGTLKATSTPPYSTNKNCLIVIVPSNGKGIVLSVRKIDVRERMFRCLDYLEVFHADVLTSPTTLCRFKHDLKEKTSFYSKGPMRILFHVDSAKYPKFTVEEGFTLTYTVVSEDIQDCIADDTFMCANGRCVPRDLLCDGRNNCGDGSDEFQEVCGLDTGSFFFLQMTDVLYVVVFSILILSIVISCGVVAIRRRRSSMDTDSISDQDEPTSRLSPYQAIHPTGFFICQNPAGPNSKSAQLDGGFTNPCYPTGIPQPPPPYSE